MSFSISFVWMRRVASVGLAVVAGALTGYSQPAFEAFDPNADGNVYALVVQPDGKLIIGGAFSTLRPNNFGPRAVHFRIARLNADGTVDVSFAPGFNADVTALALQPDGKILVGGKFDRVEAPGVPAQERNGIARLNPDGTIDASFVDPKIVLANGEKNQPFPIALVRTIAVQTNGQILIGGSFGGFKPDQAVIGTANLARLNANGGLDASFTASANNVVQAITLLEDGKILVGGGFSRFRPTGASSLGDTPFLVRLLDTGALDPAFTVRPNNRVLALAVEIGSRVLVGGEFTRLTVGATATTRTFLARILADGSVDPTFDPRPDAAIETLAVQVDGKVVAGGRFANVRPVGGIATFNAGVVRLTPLGTVDPSFAANTDGQVFVVAVRPDNSVFMGGGFTSVGSRAFVATSRGRLARIQADGTVEAGFASSASERVRTILRQSDGKVLVGGEFSTVGGVSRGSFARLNENGTLDASFYPVVEGSVLTAAIQSDGKILIGGTFARVSGETRSNLARLNTDGTLDLAFDPRVNNAVNALVVLPGDKILAGGVFTGLQPGGTGDAIVRNYLARLNTNGTVDEAFQCNFDAQVSALLRQTDDTVIVGGNFNNVVPKGAKKAVFRRFLCRIKGDGVLEAFDPRPNGPVLAMAAQADGKIILGGAFSGLIPINASALFIRNFAARISADGLEVDSFDPSPNGPVFAVALLPDNSIAIGGNFVSVQPNGATTVTARANFAWLEPAGTLHPTRNFQLDDFVYSALPLPDNRLLVGGQFRTAFQADGTSTTTENHLIQFAASGAPDPGFFPSATGGGTGVVNAIAVQGDGQFLVGGSFGDIGGSPNTNLTRLSLAGRPDAAFGVKVTGAVQAFFLREPSGAGFINTGPVVRLTTNGAIFPGYDLATTTQLIGTVEVALQMPDGGVIVGGGFSLTGSTTVVNLARLDANGSLVPGFAASADGVVSALALDDTGRILVGGTFENIAGQPRRNFARLLATGALDTSIDLRPNGTVLAIEPLTSGRFLLGGTFTSIQPHGTTTVTTRAYIVRANADGTLDTAFNPAPNNAVRSFLPQGADKIFIGGDFTTVGTTSQSGIALVNSTSGALDTAFTVSVDGPVLKLHRQDANTILVGGSFFLVRATATATGVSRSSLARLTISAAGAGTLDDTFNVVPNSSVSAIGLSGGKIVIGGGFTRISNLAGTQTSIRRFVARLNLDGSLDDSLNPQPNSQVTRLLPQTDGSVILVGAFNRMLPEALIFIGGEFTDIGASGLQYLARLNSDGSSDSSFTPAPNAAVYALAGQVDGSMVVAGDFTTISGQPRARLARYSSTDVLDAAFAPSVDGPVFALSLEPDGDIVLGGRFTTVAGSARSNVARITTTGVIDAAFAPTVVGDVSAIVVQPDGKILLSGAFSTVNGVAQPFLARLNANGTLDAGFRPVINGAVAAVSLQSDGAILIGGSFTQVAGTARSRFARLTAAGALDATVAIGFDGEVRALLLQSDGRVLAGGSFAVAGDRARHLVTQVSTGTIASQSFAIDTGLSTITWSNTGARSEFGTVRFDTSTDGTTWTDLGVAGRTGTPGEWRLSGVTGLPSNQLYFVRARATLVSSRQYSTSRFETVWQLLNNQVAGPLAASVGGSGTAGTGGTGGSGSDGGAGSGGGGSGGGSTGGAGSGGIGGGGGSGGVGGGSTGAAASSYHLSNFSVRARPGDGQKLIAGFVIRTAASEQVVLRAVGPGLIPMGISGAMPSPLLELFAQDGQWLNASAAWNGDAALAQVFVDVGAFAFDPASADAALAPSLAPGLYSAHVSPATAANGIALAEVYFAGNSDGAGGLANLSARGPAGEGDTVLIVGFIVGGDQPRRFLVRGVGPGLLPHGVADALVDPSIWLFNGDGDLVAANDNWQTQTVGTAADISAAEVESGAFALQAGSTDAALLLTLAPGTYTAHVVPAAGSAPAGVAAGTGLVEVYELP